MLIAHASSTCDVCLESFTEDCSYHTIPCGHVFCLPCLVSTNPSKCPLCRHEFSSYTMRKLHLTLPTSRELMARKLEMKLEVQEWLEGEAQEEFLVLRAFAAVLCGFHETKDKLVQNQAAAERNELELKRLLEEARNAPNPDADAYKSKYRAIREELADVKDECDENRARAEHTESELKRLLEEARSASNLDLGEYKAKVRT
ncbi:hypothetical protein K439DRAFT_501652 [Ramaria rubella]|nr:hypothetical protein K439DRAFT_501652 [Ramaria rubella]